MSGWRNSVSSTSLPPALMITRMGTKMVMPEVSFTTWSSTPKSLRGEKWMLTVPPGVSASQACSSRAQSWRRFCPRPLAQRGRLRGSARKS